MPTMGPGFIPTVRADSLELYIGTAGWGRCVAGSHTLADVEFAVVPGQPGATTFSPEDVGCPVFISGGGPVNPLMPVIYFTQGAGFHTTIASYVSPTEVTLTDAPVTSIYDLNFSTITVYRRCLVSSDVATAAPQLEYDSSIAPGTKDTLTFTVLAHDSGGYVERFSVIARSQPVFLTSSDPNVCDWLTGIFGGYIRSINVSNYVGTTGVYSWTASCSGWEGIAIRRVVAPAIPQVFTGPAGEVFTKISLTYLIDEGTTITVPSGLPVITVTCAVGARVNQLLDQVVSAVTTSDQGWFWKSDAWRNYSLAFYGVVAAPWDVDDGTDLFAGSTPQQVGYLSTDDQMANTAYGLGDAVLLNALNASLLGNGAQVNFNLPLPVGQEPIITLNGAPQTVGIAGIDTGKDWYWSFNSTALQQDSNGSVMLPGDVLLVKYKTQTPGVSQAFNVGSLDYEQNIGCTSGIFEDTVKVTTPILPADLLVLATAKEIQYGFPAQTVSCSTLRPGLATGQLQNITLPQSGITGGAFLIATIKMTIAMGNLIQWDYTAFGGANIGNAITGLVQFINRGSDTLNNVSAPTPVVASGYLNAQEIIIDHTQVPSDQDLFPLAFHGMYTWLTDAANGGQVQSSSGFDIIFSTTPDGNTPIPFELVSYNGATGDVQFWVRIGILSSAVDTIIYCMYNNPAIAGNQSNPAGVWAPHGIAAAQPNPNYHGVYHLKESTGPYHDSSGYGNNSISQIGSYPTATTGLMGFAQNFNNSQGIEIPGTALNNGTPNDSVTFSGWVKTSQATDGSMLMCYGGAGNHGASIAIAGLSASGKAAGIRDDGGASTTVLSSAPINDGNWHMLHFTVGGGVGLNDSRLYVDGAIQGSPGLGLTVGFANTIPVGMGNDLRAGVFPYGINGTGAEFRILQYPLSADWIACEYANQKVGSTFYRIGTQSGGTTTDVTVNPQGTVTVAIGTLTADDPVFGAGGTTVKAGAKTGVTNRVVTASGSPGTGDPLIYNSTGDATPGDPGQLVPSGGTSGQVLEKNSSTDYDTHWVTPGAGSSPLTTKGDVYGYDTADARIAVGADGDVLTADSGAALGVSWQPGGGSGGVIGTAKFNAAAGSIGSLVTAGIITGVTYTAVGRYTVTISPTTSDYIVTGSVMESVGTSVGYVFVMVGTYSSSGFVLGAFSSNSNAFIDFPLIMVSIIKI